MLCCKRCSPTPRGGRRGQPRVHAKPRPLARDAVTHDWASFLGPSHNGVSTETKLSRTLPRSSGSSKGHRLCVAGHRRRTLVFIHRAGDEEIVECLHPETGGGVAVSVRHGVRGPLRVQQRPALEPGHRRRPRVHDGRRRQASLPRARIGKGAVEARPAGGVQGAAGLLRHGVDAAGRRQAADCQCRCAGRAVRRRVRHGDGPRGLARGQGVGSELRVAGSGDVHGKRRVFVFAGGESSRRRAV